jgi:hypothetical protein
MHPSFLGLTRPDAMPKTCNTPGVFDAATALCRPASFAPAPCAPARIAQLAGLLGAAALLGACASNDFLRQYNDIGQKNQAPTATYCPDVRQLKAEQLYGEWTLELPEANQRGRMRLSRHPEFSESLRGHVQHGPVNAIASGDVSEGKFDLDESSDGKRLTSTWSGQLPAAACGDEIRGQWSDVDSNQSSSFVLYRVKPAAPRATGPAALSTTRPAPPVRPAPSTPPAQANARRPGFPNTAPSAAHTDGAREDVNDLPNGVRVDRVPDPGLN